MGFFEKAKNYVKEAFEKYGDVANPGGFVGRPEAPKAEAPKTEEAKPSVKDKILAFKNEYLKEVKELYATYGANPGGMIEKPVEEAKKAEPKKKEAVAAAVAAKQRGNGR